MSLFQGLFGSYGVAIDPAALRPLSQGEIQELQVRNYQWFQPAPDASMLNYYLMAANYRPPVHVPEGWADWYQHGDNLH